MKNTINLFIALIAIFALSCGSSKSKVETAQIDVNGNCGSCKSRIEKAAYDAGAKTANWDMSTDILTVSYNPQKTNMKAIEKSVAGAGHDTQDFKASDEVSFSQKVSILRLT